MKVVVVNRHVEDVMGGSEMQCDNISRGLTDKGHEVVFVAPAGKPGRDYKRNYKVVPVASDAKAIADAVLAQNPDIVYWRFNKYFFYRSAKAIAAKNIPIVFALSHVSDTQLWSSRDKMFKGPIQFLRAVKQGLVNLYNHQGHNHTAAATTMNMDFYDRLPAKKKYFVPNSVDDAAVPFSWPRPFVIWVSNIKTQKQPELYVKLARELNNRDIDFLMVGSIHALDYKWLETEHERTPNFRYIGPKTLHEVNGILEESLFMVHTCNPEGFGSIYIQSWLKKKPTVSFAFDPDQYIEKHKLGGFANRNWPLFVNQTARLIDDPAYRKEIGERAYDFAYNQFSIAKTVNEAEAVLKDVLASR